MATNPINKLTGSQIDSQSSALDAQEALAQTKLESTPGYYSGTGVPTSSAVRQDVQLRDIKKRQEALASQKAALDWYGKSGSEDTMIAQDPNEGLFMRSLNALSQPLYMEVGAIKNIIGKGTPGKNIFQNIDEARRGRETYGTLLNKFNVPAPIASGIGLGMDIILDPINWLGLGEFGTVGRVVKGATLKGAEGALSAAKVGGFDILETLTKYIPELGKSQRATDIADAMKEATLKYGREFAKDAPEVLDIVKTHLDEPVTWSQKMKRSLYNLGARTAEMKADIVDKAVEAKSGYEKLTGRTMQAVLEERRNATVAADYIRGLINAVPGGDTLLRNIDLNNATWTQRALISDKILNILNEFKVGISDVFDPTTGEMIRGVDQTRDYLSELKAEIAKVSARADDPNVADIILNKNRDAATQKILKIMDDANEVATKFNKKALTNHTNFDLTTALREEATAHEIYSNDLKAALIGLSENKTGIESFDKMMTKIGKINFGMKLKEGEVAWGKRILDKYNQFMGIFKSMKLGLLSPSSIMYASIGNITMTHMAGLDLMRADGALYKRWKQAYDYLSGKSSIEIEEILTNDDALMAMASEYPTYFARVFGFSYKEAQAKNIMLELKSAALEAGIDPDNSELLKKGAEIEEALNESKRLQLRKKEMRGALETIEREREMAATGISNKGKKLTESEISASKLKSEGSGMVGNELSSSAFVDLKKKWEIQAAAGNKMAKLAILALDQTKHFQIVDQTARLGTFMVLTQDGISEKELVHLMGWNSFAGASKVLPEDIEKIGNMYKIKPLRASEIVNEIYMNYNAMPAAIQVIRQLPIFGMPFVSFAYAMALKTGQTAISNPAAFNKVNFFLRELESGKSPLEKQALRSKYYAWYNTPGMLNLGKLPFFGDNPIYLNVANMIPYYSMNMFMPSERKYESGIRGQFASAIDKIPVLKDPVGQMLTDYFILPLILKDVRPQNMWGGPLYPESAKGYEKYVTGPMKNLVEAVIPTSAALPGYVASMFMSDKAISMMPSYSFKKAAFSSQGKTSVGVIGKEDPMSRGVRDFAGNLGIKAYPLNLTNLTSEVKKSIKKK